jgi:hypothetical protein
MLEEQAFGMTFEHRKVEMLEGKVKAQKKTIESLISANERAADIINDHKTRVEALEKQSLRLSKLVDPTYQE